MVVGVGVDAEGGTRPTVVFAVVLVLLLIRGNKGEWGKSGSVVVSHRVRYDGL